MFVFLQVLQVVVPACKAYLTALCVCVCIHVYMYSCVCVRERERGGEEGRGVREGAELKKNSETH